MNSKTDSLLEFLDSSPCNFLAVDTIRRRLVGAGFEELNLADAWQLQAGKKYFTTKNDTAVFAFVVGSRPASETGFRIIAAHSDSPCFRIKPNAEMLREGVVSLNTEVYGGPILYTWFDRPLSLAGRVMLRGADALHPRSVLIDFERPLLVIPHLAIHFNREVNNGNKLSKQKDMIPVLALAEGIKEKGNMLVDAVAERLGVDRSEIIDFDLMVYNQQKAVRTGIRGELFMSGRIDDLSMAHAAIEAIVDGSGTECTRVAAIFDNEETGSGTKQGAASPVLKTILHRIDLSQGGNDLTFYQAIERTFMISADNAHATHPNYPEKYDPTNHPLMGGGPVIKINANCKYMTDAHSSAVFAELCREADVPVQYFVNHSDSAGGSTLGNILTSQIDIAGVDVGNPIWAMHSAMETGSAFDHECMVKVFTHFFS